MKSASTARRSRRSAILGSTPHRLLHEAKRAIIVVPVQGAS